jgi:ubiquinone/menaquinone biosynthesis C-methylase UbiE
MIERSTSHPSYKAENDMPDGLKPGVIRFYDTHPINEDEILAKLEARGKRALDAITEDDLKDFDQDHYGGVDAVESLATRAGIARQHHVLDVCSGMGGPARWIAHRIGCHVTGLDFTQSRVEGARRLTKRVGLDGRVDFVQGDATAMPLPSSRYDAVLAQEAWVHIADKPTLISECVRVLKPHGVLAFTDIVARNALPHEAQERLSAEMQYAPVGVADRYVDLLTQSQCHVDSREDLSEDWTIILQGRLEMYRSLRDTTVAKFGEARYAEYDRAYSHFVGLFVARKLGGVRIIARRLN